MIETPKPVLCRPVLNEETGGYYCPICGYGKGWVARRAFYKACNVHPKVRDVVVAKVAPRTKEVADSFPPGLKESRLAACQDCEWMDAGRCLAQTRANCDRSPRIDEIAGHLGATCPEGRWP